MEAAAAIYRRHGDPLEVLKRESLAVRKPGPDEVMVEVRFAPINPADLNTIEGKYPIQPPLPAVGGIEGVGVVTATGTNVRDLEPGAAVLLPQASGTWRERLVLPAQAVLLLGEGMPLEQAAMLRVNPMTAWRMLHDFVRLERGSWVVQNAANSAVGRAVIQLAASLEIRTVNVVRRPELVTELEREGADIVLCDGDDLGARIAAATADEPILLGLNAVGGSSAIRLANALAPGGTVVTYGAMAREPIRIPNGLLIFKDIRWRGFWVSRWYEQAAPDEKKAVLLQLASLLRDGVIRAPVEKIYSLSEIREAIAHAQRPRREGKILFRPSS